MTSRGVVHIKTSSIGFATSRKLAVHSYDEFPTYGRSFLRWPNASSPLLILCYLPWFYTTFPVTYAVITSPSNVITETHKYNLHMGCFLLVY